MKKLLLKSISILVLIGVVVFYAHFNNIKLASPVVNGYYFELKELLTEKGYTNNLLVISSKRFKWENKLYQKISVAAPNSNHLTGDAIDIIVGDINSDGKINGEDVDIVYQILDTEIVMDKGGVGAYKNTGWLSRQMIHIDYRSKRVRWNY